MQSPDSARVLALLKRHGWNSNSFQVLEPGYRYWFEGDDACIAYVEAGRAWVVAGAPIAPPGRFAELIAAFRERARAAGKRVCCFGTQERFRERVGWPALQIGEQPTWTPALWEAGLRENAGLREQLRRARAKGVLVRRVLEGELAGPDAPLRRRIDGLIARWRAGRPMAPMGFLVQVEPYAFPEERLGFVAEHEGRVVGFLGVIPVYARGGWFLEDFLRDPAAPNGTIELLIDAGMRAAAAAGVPYATLGLVPLTGQVPLWLRVARRGGAALYDFEGLRTFKAKLAPTDWEPIYLSFPRRGLGPVAVLDALTAFATGGLVRFGLHTLLRGAPFVLRAFAWLLVPWIALLSLRGSRAWFPADACRWGWVVFDVAICAGLFALARRWRPRLALALALLVTLDALATLAQVAWLEWLRRDSPGERLVLLVSVLAPALAASVLWSARARRSRIARPVV
ncbi:MAG: DUF2156 domain-containing protein [Planctomycetes bacterium]|nr:DUF2156 domain-containing protein [Planctomycetota bacterium]